MNNFFVDTHAHVFSKTYDNIFEILEEAQNNNINYVINSGYDYVSNKEVLSLINTHDNMYGTIGIHPSEASNYIKEDITHILNNIQNKKIVAIGEIGLDYYYTKENKEEQIMLFEQLLKIAEENNIPVVIHSREATEDTLKILKKYKCAGVIHSFSGSLETAMEYIKIGYAIGINGVVTFKNSKFKEYLNKIPLENIVLETDCPFLTPSPFRGKQNSPKHVKEIADFVANIYNIPVSSLAKITNENVLRIFDKIHKL